KIHFDCSFCLRAKRTNEFLVRSFAHSRIKVNDVEPRILLEFLQQAKNVGDSKFAPSTVHQLNGLPVLQINAGNQHGQRASTPLAARNSLSARMGCTPS